MKRLWRPLAIAAVVALVAAACGGDEADETTTTTMAEAESVLALAVEAGQFSTLVAAIEAAGLAETLEGEGPFTVFAPTDAAFESAFEALGITADELLADTDTLTAILTYHVLPQEANSQLVATLDGQSVETVNGAEVSISVDGGNIMVNEASVVSADLEAENGVVHVINAVLLPPDVAEAFGLGMDESMDDTTTTTVADTTTTTAADTTTTTAAEAGGDTIADIVVGDENFSTLLAAVEAAGLTEALADPDATLTVFAPTNEAFEAALAALGLTAEELLADTETLTSILTYHVLGEVVTSADIIGAGVEEIPVETLNGAELVVRVTDEGSVTFADQGETMVTQADVEASNGVIHVIDGVLLPPQG